MAQSHANMTELVTEVVTELVKPEDLVSEILDLVTPPSPESVIEKALSVTLPSPPEDLISGKLIGTPKVGTSLERSRHGGRQKGGKEASRHGGK